MHKTRNPLTIGVITFNMGLPIGMLIDRSGLIITLVALHLPVTPSVAEFLSQID